MLVSMTKSPFSQSKHVYGAPFGILVNFVTTCNCNISTVGFLFRSKTSFIVKNEARWSMVRCWLDDVVSGQCLLRSPADTGSPDQWSIIMDTDIKPSPLTQTSTLKWSLDKLTFKIFQHCMYNLQFLIVYFTSVSVVESSSVAEDDCSV